MKKCPPGVFCIENVTMTFIFFTILILFFFIYFNQNREKIIIKNENSEKTETKEKNFPSFFGSFLPNIPYNNFQRDVLLNPYTPPLNDERYFVPQLNYVVPGSIPINVSTNIGAIETNYRQVGILTPLNCNNSNNILPLMGRILFNRRDLWNYYTISNQHNNIKLSILVKGKNALNDNGVDKLYSDDIIYIDGVNEKYKVKIYENDTIRYLPSI